MARTFSHPLFITLPTVCLLTLVAAGCAHGGAGSRDPIFAGGGQAALLPMVTATAPANGSVNVPVNDQALTIQFSVPVAPLGGSFTLTTLAPGVEPSGTVTMDATGTLATFTLAAGTTLQPGTLYTASVGGALDPATGLALAAPYIWSFTTGTLPDTARPVVLATSPATTVPGPTLAVPTNTAIAATFSRDMAPGTLTAATFTLASAGSAAVPTGSVSYSVESRTAFFVPSVPLQPATTYMATVTRAAMDLAGSALAGNAAPLPASSNYAWSFTTGSGPDLAPPTLTLEFPVNLAALVPLNTLVSATFSGAMNFATAQFVVQATSPLASGLTTGAVSYDPMTFTASFTPSARLAPNTTYTASILGATDLAGNVLAPGLLPNPWTFTTGTTATAAGGAISLGSASTFGIMATAAITSTGASIINGDVSLAPGSSLSGFPPATVNGTIHVDDAQAAQARTDLLTAFNTATSLAPGTTVPPGSDLGAAYPHGLPPGTYTSGSTLLIATPLTLDAGGNSNAVWVFQIGSSLTTGASVILANGAQACNVFWVPALDATVGVGTVFYGTILAGRNVTGVTGATINGRILAGATTAGTIALETNLINVPAQH